MRPDDDHIRWSELAAGHVMSALDDDDEAAYLEHSATCDRCQGLERDLSAELADLASLPRHVEPPAALKASIMRAVAEDDADHSARVVPMASHGRHGQDDRGQDDRGHDAWGGASGPAASAASAGAPRRRPGRLTVAITAAAAAVVVVVGVVVGLAVTGGHGKESIAQRCADVNCPTVSLLASGKHVATVMVLDKTAYVQATGLPATPAGDSYVLWRISPGAKPVAVAAMHTKPSDGPMAAGPMATPVAQISSFAISVELGDTAPSAPSDVIAQGNTA